MSHEQTVDSWESFLEKLKRLKAQHLENFSVDRRVLFRGQQNAKWPLATTLERFGGAPSEFVEYYRTIAFLRPQIETLTQNHWDIPNFSEIAKLVRKYDEFSRGNIPAYGYMAHLRHHGFPSPLLDWSRSPFVAAYFAFNRDLGNEHASIYVLFEARSHSGSSRAPQIINLGNYVKTHRRHFLQQSEYTICLYFDEEWKFASHEGNFEEWEERDYADNFSVYKFNIPVSERLKVLKSLDEFNMNAFSLFGTEESLMETLALREIQFTSEN